MKLFFSFGLVLLLFSLVSCSHPENPIIDQAEQLRADKKYNEALSLINSSLRDNLVDNPGLLREAVRIEVETGDIDEGYQTYRHLVRKVSKNDSVLIELVHEKDPQIRANAARTLALTLDSESAKGETMNSDTVPVLIKTLSDPEADVRRAAVYALGKIGDARAVPPLIETLQDSSWWVRADAAHALGDFRDSRAVPPLLKLLDDTDPQVLTSTQNALISLVKQPDVNPFIDGLNSSNPKVALNAAICLASVRNYTGNPILIKSLQSDQVPDRLMALQAMRFGLDPTNLTYIRAALKDPAPEVEAEALRGIYAYGDKSSLSTVQSMANDDHTEPRVRKMCNQLVGFFEGQSPTPPASSPNGE